MESKTKILNNANIRRIVANFSRVLVFLFVFFSVYGVANAASLYFSPQSGSYTVGSTFAVNIYVESKDQAMNAASGVISFPSDKLEITSLSKTGSIFSLWVQDPSFSNTQGVINFEGIVLNPGFTGASGKAISINFRTKAAGNASLAFSSGSVLANDGKGTNILTGMGNATFSIGAVEPEAPKIVAPAGVAGTPAAPEINSPTHPDPDKWYAVKDAKFIWNAPEDITGVRLLMGKDPQAVPTITYTSPITSKEITDVTDGTWYFSVRLRNAQGWGGISHFRFRIDTKPPEPFVIKFVDGKETDNPRPTALFDTADTLSGIDYYKVKIGEGNFFSLSGTEVIKENPYTMPLQSPGKRTILVQAYDRAGNYATDAEEFIIKTLEPPTIIDYPKELQSGEVLIIRGKTKYLDAQINLWIQHEKDEAKSYVVKSDKDGKFTFVAEDRLQDGIYIAWAEVIDARGAKSNPSEKVTIMVRQSAFFRIGSWAVGFLVVVIPLIVLVMALTAILWYGWHKFASFRKKIKKEVNEAEQALHRAFDLLREDIREQIKMLEKTKTKRKLTEEEEKIIKRLEKHLDDAEKFVRKEIEDIV